MPLRKNNTRTFHRTLYAGELETVVVYKRDGGPYSGSQRAIKLFECRWKPIEKTGQPLVGDNSSDHRRELVIPRSELDRVGIGYIIPGDKFSDAQGRYWQTESDNMIEVKLFENFVNVQTKRTDPPQGVG